MNNPIVFISRNRIKPGMVEAFRRHYTDSIPSIETGKPGTLVQFSYESEDATEVTVVRLFRDADGLDQQLQSADKRAKRTYDFIEPVSIEIYGRPNAGTIETMKEIAGLGVPVHIHPQYIGGFIR
jgi:hypothetical protein